MPEPGFGCPVYHTWSSCAEQLFQLCQPPALVPDHRCASVELCWRTGRSIWAVSWGCVLGAAAWEGMLEGTWTCTFCCVIPGISQVCSQRHGTRVSHKVSANSLFIESQNDTMVEAGSNVWKPSRPTLLLKAGSDRAGCVGHCPNESWIASRMEKNSDCLGNMFQCSITAEKKKRFLCCLNRLSCIWFVLPSSCSCTGQQVPSGLVFTAREWVGSDSTRGLLIIYH